MGTTPFPQSGDHTHGGIAENVEGGKEQEKYGYDRSVRGWCPLSRNQRKLTIYSLRHRVLMDTIFRTKKELGFRLSCGGTLRSALGPRGTKSVTRRCAPNGGSLLKMECTAEINTCAAAEPFAGSNMIVPTHCLSTQGAGRADGMTTPPPPPPPVANTIKPGRLHQETRGSSPIHTAQ